MVRPPRGSLMDLSVGTLALFVVAGFGGGFINDITKQLKAEGLVQAGDRIVQLASMPIEAKGTTNTLRIKDVQ